MPDVLLPPLPEPEDAVLIVARPLVGTPVERLDALVEAPVEAADNFELFMLEDALLAPEPLALEFVSAELCIDELPLLSEGVSVGTEPVETPPVRPEVEEAEVPDVVWF